MPEHVVNYLLLVAEDARNIMAKMGFRKMDDIVGRADTMTVNPTSFCNSPLVLTKLLTPAFKLPDAGKIGKIENRKLYEQDHSNICPPGSVTYQLIELFADTLKTGKPSRVEVKDMRNLERSCGTTLSHKVYQAFGYTLPPMTAHAKLEGTSGQSFGAFAVKGMFLELEGDSQDYFGKGLSGAVLAVYPHRGCLGNGFKAEENVIIGNVALYGGITGAAFIRGICAERFAVRNSGVWAVVEGAGDHCCEYMTGGRIVVLGKIGGNFAAGMSGGCAWIWDPKGVSYTQINPELVEVERLSVTGKHPCYPHAGDDLKELLEAHVKFTGSTVAGDILARWPSSMNEFLRVLPTDYKNALGKTDKGLSATVAFRGWISAGQEMPSDAKKQKTDKEPVAKSFTMPSLDLEDVKFERPNIVDPKTIKGNKGFVQYARHEIMKRDATERANDFLEVYDHKNEDQVKTQAARCMDCGTPFCHQSVTIRSGCPLGNLIPEWNDLVKRGEWYQAFMRLRETNNFPEFTGRVCPAPCEAACTLGIIDDPVSIKSAELMIVDKAYENGWMDPMPPPSRTGKRVAVIGSGPSGLAAADEMNKMGHTVTVYERSCRPGGLMMYGVPNMKTDKVHIVQRRTDIMAKEGVIFICGKDGNVGAEDGPTPDELLAKNDAVLLATGATIGRDLNQVPGRKFKGIHLAMEFLHGNTKSLLDSGAVDTTWRRTSANISKPPIDAIGRHVVIIGGGDTGNDCIGTSVRHGAKSINNLELLPQPPPERAANTPWPHWPNKHRSDYGHEEAAKMINGGKDIRTFSVQTKEFIGDAMGNVVGIKIVDLSWASENGQMKMKEVAGTERTLPCDLVLLALGFLGPEASLAQKFGVTVERGNYKATFGKGGEPGCFRTSNPKVFAAGDCRRGQSLVVWGIAEGREAAVNIHEQMMGQK
jgi:glutamate synthase (NADPH/NADH)